jgi:cell division protein FtsB
MRKRNYLKSDRNSRDVRNRKMFLAAAFLAAAYLLASLIFGEMGLIKYFRMKARYDSLTREIAELRHDNVRLMKDVRSLRSDPDHLERIARDKLGLARPGEIVYYYGEP